MIKCKRHPIRSAYLRVNHYFTTTGPRTLHGGLKIYDFYLLVLKTIFYSLAALVRKILFSPLEDKKSYLPAAV
jgi:hypothetical protein